MFFAVKSLPAGTASIYDGIRFPDTRERMKPPTKGIPSAKPVAARPIGKIRGSGQKSSNTAVPPRKRGLEEDVTFLTMLRQVETFEFFFMSDTETYEQVDDFEQNNGTHHRDSDGGYHADQLVDELMGVPLE